MAVVKNLMVRAGADFSAITKQANKVNQSLSGMQSTFDKVGASIKKAFTFGALAAATKALISAGKDAKESYDQQAEAQAKLAQVMRNTMGASAKEISSITELADAQQKLGVISADTQIAAAQELATYLQMPSSLKTLLPVLNDMAAQQFGYNATAEQTTTIATMLGKVMNGQTGALSRYGYTFTSAQEAVLKYGTEAERAAVLADVVTQSVGGMNAALANTPSGRLQKVNNALDDIKAQFGQAFTIGSTAFIPLLNNVASTLAAIANIANRVAQAFANVFGGSVTTQAVDYAAAAANAGAAGAAGMDKLANATKKAGAAAKEATSLASFDTIHVLADKSKSGGGGSGSDDTDVGGVSVGGGGGMILGAEETVESVGWLETALGKLRDFAAGLDFGPLEGSLGRLGESARGLGETISGGLAWALDNVLAPLASWTVSDLLPAFFDTLASAVDLLNAALVALAPLGSWLWENFLQPLAAWTGDIIIEALGNMTENLNALADLLTGKLSLSEYIAQMDSFQVMALSVAAALGTVKVATLGITTIKAAEKIPDLVKKVSSLSGILIQAQGPCRGLEDRMKLLFGEKSILAGVGALIGGAILAITNFISMLQNGFSWLNEALMVVGIAIAAIGAVILGAPAAVAAVIAAIVAAVATAVVLVKQHWSDIVAWFQGIGTKISETFSGIWTGIVNIWSGCVEWFQGLGVKISEVFSGIWTGIVNGAKSIINGLLGWIEGFVNGIIGGFNLMKSAINSLSFTIPDWVPGIGGATVGFNIPLTGTISLPRLATGAVIPPNNEFMAVLGDQPRGMNIETPEDLLRQIVREENDNSRILDAMDDILSAIRAGKVIAVDREVLGRTVQESMGATARSSGLAVFA